MSNPTTEPRRKTSAFHWHRPLMLLAGAMLLCTLVSLGGLIFDPRLLTGLSIWMKPLKFSVSIGIYCVSWAWLISQMHRFRRMAWWTGALAAAGLLTEQVIILGDVVRGTTSHYNVSTPFDAALWAIMAASISVVWIATLAVAAILFANPGPDPARNLAIRLGSLIGVLGMALGFLMTIPTKAQLASGSGILGAHTVGPADGGPGLPFLGWSTVGGDLRAPHFVGMHALQTLPIICVLLELGGRRSIRLAAVSARVRLVWTAATGYLAILAILTWQALRGQSVAHPDSETLLASTALLGAITIAVATVLHNAGRYQVPQMNAGHPNPTELQDRLAGRLH